MLVMEYDSPSRDQDAPISQLSQNWPSSNKWEAAGCVQFILAASQCDGGTQTIYPELAVGQHMTTARQLSATTQLRTHNQPTRSSCPRVPPQAVLATDASWSHLLDVAALDGFEACDPARLTLHQQLMSCLVPPGSAQRNSHDDVVSKVSLALLQGAAPRRILE
jgi:hypothetical protein